MNTLFNTDNLFTLSGNQTYQQKEFIPPERKARLPLLILSADNQTIKEVTRASTDELYERKVFKKDWRGYGC